MQWVQERPLEIEHTGDAQAQACPSPLCYTVGWLSSAYAALQFWHSWLEGMRPCEHMPCKTELEQCAQEHLLADAQQGLQM